MIDAVAIAAARRTAQFQPRWTGHRSPAAAAGWLAAIVGLVATLGCGEKSARNPVTGTVTLDAQPVLKGQIAFIPLPGTKGPTAGAPVIDGRYEIAAAGGPMAGTFRVEITALQPTPRKKEVFNVATGKTELTDEYESLLPPRYNRGSELKADVTADGPNQFDFPLKSE